jgi:leucyl/phenylalanyl-tRNA---protein transferase
MQACATTPRKGEHGTWITNEMKYVYTELHNQGFAHSAETWKDDVLVGGMYGVRIGKVFFAESMFSIESNASKFALVN